MQQCQQGTNYTREAAGGEAAAGWGLVLRLWTPLKPYRTQPSALYFSIRLTTFEDLGTIGLHSRAVYPLSNGH